MNEIARRDALHAVVGLASAAAVGIVTGRRGSTPPDRSTAPDAVPATADGLVYANVDILRRDAGLRALTTAALQQRAQYQSGDGPADRPRTVGALLSDLEADFRTDPAKVHRVTAYGDVGGEGEALSGGYGGVVLEAELTAEDVTSGLENVDDIDFAEVRDSGSVVYEPDADDGPWVGALPSDRVVAGTEAAVYDAIAVTNDEMAAVGEPLSGAYTDTRDGPVRFASRLPDPSDNDAVPRAVDGGAGRSVDLGPLGDVTTLAGAVYRDGDVRGLEATLESPDAAAANDVASVVRELRERAESELRDAELADLVGDIGVERDGSAVTASVSRTVNELESLVDSE